MMCTKPLLVVFISTILFKTSYCATSNCCSLEEPELRAIIPHSSCPIGTHSFSAIFALTAKCDECPEGSCRINLSCYCPQDFISSDTQQELCRYSFNEKWPLSTTEEDTTWRSCAKEPPSSTTDDNCCSLNKTELEDRVGTSNECPKDSVRTFSSVQSLSEKCDRCPFGTCRVDMACYCPKDFLASDAQQELCRSSFSEKWDESIGLEDRHGRSCVRPTPSQSFTFDSCCALSPAQLEIRVGTGNSCPLNSLNTFTSVEMLSGGCDVCPYGSCRVASQCYCPQDFLNSDAQQELCRESFGEVYPDSVGKPDVFCPKNPKPQILTPGATPSGSATTSDATSSDATSSDATSSDATSSDATSSDATSSEATSSSAPSSGATNTPSSSSDGPNVESSAPSDQSGSEQDGPNALTDEEESSSDEKLSTAEIVGIVIGSVTGIISALGVVIAWCKCSRSK